MFNIDRRILAHFDFITIILLIPLIFTSGWLIYEIHPTLGQKHLVYVSVGIGVFITLFLLPIRRMLWMIPIFYWVSILLLIAVEFVGHARLGAKRWIEIPFIHFTLQPSELLKPAFVLMLAYLISRNPPPRDGYGLKDFLKLSFFILFPFILIAKEPDLGTATVLVMLGFGILFIVGVHWKIWVGLIAAFVISLPLVYTQLHDYQKQRLTDFVSEKPSYHVEQSMIAVGSGGFFGKAKEDATQTQMKFLPIASSDFIFAYVVERFGFFGAFLLISLYAALILHLMITAFWTEDYYIKVVAGGISLLFFIYMAVNIAMTIGVAPVVGVPLPMFSYGGSSFVNFMVLLAVMENLLAYRFRYLYGDTGKKSFL
ncbi:FtsW/RodA/SpoVE family cell cycle protein [Sulfuricurvum sp.]|uniref:FtsW/RodA/SpoVE family cell cycle protein n=1 Tax=Sulfuricurvum sp. TaxID=2025608 RepID=UPI0026026542|nr:FtsW/RodA/SpoVE family cell cycle protein [Sulfuricurvum sp.]MDD2266134.1 FtsW/RodA/SpoVE family cell cycle protein [Sulfuricurvum sp.]MDD2783170.1 FtsW/RodA/SpoVE family cell cycle protein [Sulfuricurvum sp.]HZF70886.1 FtsW/RodA/SpoVE family cell cycle protein [Sulfuricurvum sp.]